MTTTTTARTVGGPITTTRLDTGAWVAERDGIRCCDTGHAYGGPDGAVHHLIATLRRVTPKETP